MRTAALSLVVALTACTEGVPRATRPASQPAPVTTPAAPSPSSASPSASPSTSPVPSPVPSGFVPESVWFRTRLVGWVLGAAGAETVVAGTTDGGRTWSSLGTIPVGVEDAGGRAHVRRIRFTEGDFGWASGSVSYETGDGGVTWHRQSGRAVVSARPYWTGTATLAGTPDGATVRGAEVWSSDGHSSYRLDGAGVDAAWDDLVADFKSLAYRTAAGRLRVSRDAGRTWRTRTVCPDRLVDVDGASEPSPAPPREQELYLLCDGSLRHSHDGGGTVTVRSRATARFTEVAVAWPGMVVLTGPALAVSPDGGRTLRTVSAPADTVRWTEPRMVDGSFGTVVRVGRTAREVWVTTDAGATWRPMRVR